MHFNVILPILINEIFIDCIYITIEIQCVKSSMQQSLEHLQDTRVTFVNGQPKPRCCLSCVAGSPAWSFAASEEHNIYLQEVKKQTKKP